MDTAEAGCTKAAAAAVDCLLVLRDVLTDRVMAWLLLATEENYNKRNNLHISTVQLCK